MNPDNESERAMPSEQDPASGAQGRDGSRLQDGSWPQDASRPGTTDVQAYIGRQLRAVYDDVVKQPVPDRFLVLMRQLEEQAPED